jgi:anti-sigma B factor antagonist
MEVSEAETGHLVVRISGEIDLSSVTGLEVQVDDLVTRRAEQVDLDLSELSFMDSSGIALLLRITNHFGPVEVTGANQLIRRVVEATGLAEILKLGQDPA